MDTPTTGPLVPPMPRRDTPTTGAEAPHGFGEGHSLPLASPAPLPVVEADPDVTDVFLAEPSPVEVEVEALALADLDEDADDLPEPLPAPVETVSPNGKDLVLVRDGVVVAAPESVYVVDADVITGPSATADDLFAALKMLGQVNPSPARDTLVEEVNAAMRGRMGL